MTVVLIAVIVILAAVIAALVRRVALGRDRRRRPLHAASARRILFPFVTNALSLPALDAALRLAVAENATLVPVFLARVPLDLPLDTPLPRQCSMGVPLLDVIEQRATAAGVPVDSRIERGRNRRHALRRAIAEERFDTIVAAAASNGNPGFDADDVAWLLDNANGEIVVLRPSADDRSGDVIAAAGGAPLPAARQGRNGGSPARGRSRASEMAASR